MANAGLFSYRTGFFTTSLALAASIALHVTAAAPRAPTSVPVSSASASAALPADAASSCAGQLAACRAESWKLVARTIATEVQDRPRAAVPPAAEPEPTSASDQKRVLCDIAEQQAREHWGAHKTEIVATIQDIGKEAWVRENKSKDAEKLAKTLGADPTERRRLDQGYDALWAKHGPILQAKIHADPENFAALADSVRAFWRDEDQLVASVMGARARDDYRASELRSRTAIAAILATFAGTPFDDQIAW